MLSEKIPKNMARKTKPRKMQPKQKHSCILVAATITLALACLLSLVAILTPHWASSTVTLKENFVIFTLEATLDIQVGLFKKDCQLRLQAEGILKYLKKSVDEICVKQLQIMTKHMDVIPDLLIGALALSVGALLCTFVAHCVTRQFVTVFSVAVLVLAQLLQVSAVLTFALGGYADAKRMSSNPIIDKMDGAPGFGLVFAFVTPMLLMVAIILLIWDTIVLRRILNNKKQQQPKQQQQQQQLEKQQQQQQLEKQQQQQQQQQQQPEKQQQPKCEET